MKTTTFFFYVCILYSYAISAQTTLYTINNKSYELKTEVEGTITLLWNNIDSEYYYFAKKGDTIIPLTNTKKGNTYQEEYKKQLQILTADVDIHSYRIDRVRLTLSNLRGFFTLYNKKAAPQYKEKSVYSNLEYRLGFFAGVSNNVFSDKLSTDSKIDFQLGIDFEIYDRKALPRHGFLLQYKQTFNVGSLRTSQFSLNHRFKFIVIPIFQAYLNTKVAAFNIERNEFFDFDIIDTRKVFTLQAPISFGLGADLKVGRGYLSLNYNDVIALFIDDNGEFPVDITIGYRYVL